MGDLEGPRPTEVLAAGLKMHLTPETKPSPTRQAKKLQPTKPANDNGNVEKIHLLADVYMHFWIDAKAGFLGGPADPKQAKAPVMPKKGQEPKESEKAHVRIKPGGPFFYDLNKETAWFESPRVIEGADGPIAPDQVHVVRSQKI